MNASQRRYRMSPKGREADRRRKARYRAGKGKLTMKLYRASPARKAALERYRAKPEVRARRRARHLRDKFGLTPRRYDYLLARQAGLCAICGEPPRGRWARLHVDHDHSTGRVRGLLCYPCNSLLGCAADQILTLYKAADYLERHKRG